MTGLLTPRQLKKIERDAYDLYEVLVAKHMWHVIARRLNKPTHVKIYSADIVCLVKYSVSKRYDVNWTNRCLLCDLYRCHECPLTSCYSSECLYEEARDGNTSAAKEIEEIIEEDWQKRKEEA